MRLYWTPKRIGHHDLDRVAFLIALGLIVFAFLTVVRG